jgi:hypothetical protein
MQILKNYRFYTELCIYMDLMVRWTLPSEKLFLVRWTRVIVSLLLQVNS